MLKDKFLKDLEIIYSEIQQREKELNSYFDYAKGLNHPKASLLVDEFLETIGLKKSQDAIVASLNYLIGLREDSLEQLMEQLGLTQEQIDAKLGDCLYL